MCAAIASSSRIGPGRSAGEPSRDVPDAPISSNRSNASPLRIISRSTRFSSSRTFPGQSKALGARLLLLGARREHGSQHRGRVIVLERREFGCLGFRFRACGVWLHLHTRHGRGDEAYS